MCGYNGCNKASVYEIQQTVGKQQTLEICERCAPEWVKQMTPSKSYRVRKIGGDWVSATSSAMTVKERQAALKARRAEKGLKEMRSLYAHPDDFKRIRDYVAQLNARRRKSN